MLWNKVTWLKVKCFSVQTTVVKYECGCRIPLWGSSFFLKCSLETFIPSSRLLNYIQSNVIDVQLMVCCICLASDENAYLYLFLFKEESLWLQNWPCVYPAEWQCPFYPVTITLVIFYMLPAEVSELPVNISPFPLFPSLLPLSD